jgi:hypothetical protein
MTFPEAFFGAMVPMLLGEREAAAVERVLGPCPSGTNALAFYAVLTRRDVTSVLDRLFVTTKTVARRARPSLWDELVDGYVRAHRSTHWEPNRFAAAFADFIAHRRNKGLDVPRVLEEVADFEYARFAVTLQKLPVPILRQYDHDVRTLFRNPATPRPPPRPTVLAIYRDARARAAWCELGIAEIAALARLRGHTIALPVEDALVDAAEQRLRALGVVARHA